jgi:hypothetical protein
MIFDHCQRNKAWPPGLAAGRLTDKLVSSPGPRRYPLVGGYAMRDKDRWAIFVVSRRLDGNHDGADFGDGATPVRLALPFQKAGKITLHKLTGDPRLANTGKMNIAIQSQDVPAPALDKGALVIHEQTGGAKGGMPAGSIFLYVLETAK